MTENELFCFIGLGCAFGVLERGLEPMQLFGGAFFNPKIKFSLERAIFVVESEASFAALHERIKLPTAQIGMFRVV